MPPSCYDPTPSSDALLPSRCSDEDRCCELFSLFLCCGDACEYARLAASEATVATEGSIGGGSSAEASRCPSNCLRAHFKTKRGMNAARTHERRITRRRPRSRRAYLCERSKKINFANIIRDPRSGRRAHDWFLARRSRTRLGSNMPSAARRPFRSDNNALRRR